MQPSEPFAMCTKKEQLVYIVASLNNTLANVPGSLMYEKIKKVLGLTRLLQRTPTSPVRGKSEI